MPNTPITIHVSMDDKIFRDFAVFDSLRLSHRWLKLLLFTLLMLAFAVLNLLTDAALLFWVFAIIGLISPLSYLYVFRSSVKKQIARFGLTRPKPVYTLTLTPENEQFTVQLPDGSSQTRRWVELFGVYRTAGYIYLYPEQKQAYILPDAQLEGVAPDELWALCRASAPDGKARDLRMKKS